MTGKPSIDRPWLNHYPEGADKVPLPEMTAYQYLYACNKYYMDGIALEYYGVKISYSAMFASIDVAARALTAIGVKRGDIVTVMMPNTPEAIYCFYGLNKIGACANMLSPTFTPEHITGSIDLTESKLLVILDKFLDMFSEVIKKSNVNSIVVSSPLDSLPPHMRLLASVKQKPLAIPKDNKYMDWKKFVKSGKNSGELVGDYEPEMPAIIVYSSGSTGAAKGVVLPNEAFTGLGAQYIAINNLNLNNARGNTALAIVPLFISTGINAVLNIILCFGVTAILEPVFDGDVFVKRMNENKPNYTLSTPSHFEHLLNSDSGDLSSVRISVAGGEALPEPLETALNDYFAQHGSNALMMKGWGMCEYGSTVTTSTKSNKVGEGTGKPVSHIIVSAFDLDTDDELSYNQRGEIRVITPCRMLGYYKNPEATAEFFREGKDGQVWGCSGDMGYIDEDGNVFIEGRAHDYIHGESGNKVWLFDIENILLADEAVQLCEAVGLSVDGRDVPVAHLVLKQNSKDNLETVLRRIHESCVKALSPDAVPHGYKVRDGFNVLPSGKRDTLSLKNERNGFVVADSDRIRKVNWGK